MMSNSTSHRLTGTPCARSHAFRSMPSSKSIVTTKRSRLCRSAAFTTLAIGLSPMSTCLLRTITRGISLQGSRTGCRPCRRPTEQQRPTCNCCFTGESLTTRRRISSLSLAEFERLITQHHVIAARRLRLKPTWSPAFRLPSPLWFMKNTSFTRAILRCCCHHRWQQ